jgi:hypothetical protein
MLLILAIAVQVATFIFRLRPQIFNVILYKGTYVTYNINHAFYRKVKITSVQVAVPLRVARG